MINLVISSSLIIFLYAESGYETYEPQSYYDGGGYGGSEGVSGCCECTDSLDGPNCNQECDDTICSYDPYCCNVEWDWICADAAVRECDGTAGDYQDSYDYYDGSDYGYDDQCNCDEICYGQEPEDWEFEYDEVPPCIINNCGQQLDTCAADDTCVSGIEGLVSGCYADNEDPMQCMDELVADTENNGFTQLCDGNEECGADLKALGECVVNSANYGFCPEEEYKKLKLKSVLKTVKKRSRSNKRKSAAAKQKLKRKSRKSKRSKKRGKRASKLRKSRRKLQGTDGGDSYGSDSYYDENPEYDYGCYCDCGEEEEEIPSCIIDNCGEQLYACGGSDNCINGVGGVIEQCYENNESPQECMDELMKESNGAQAIELCGGDEEAAGDLQALGTCVINSANYGFCSEDEYKKLKVKALVKATKKVRARKVASKQRKARLSQEARSAKARRSRRARAQRQRRARAQRSRKARAQRERSRKVRTRKSRRKLQGTDGGCCECTESSDEPYCNEECDNTICSYDPYCCNEEYGSWDWICAAAAVNECNGDEGGNGFDYYEPPTASAECCECTDSSDSPFCNEECDANICSYDPYCCNVEWDWICANSAKDECVASGNSFEDGGDSGCDSFYGGDYSYGDSFDYGTDSYNYGPSYYDSYYGGYDGDSYDSYQIQDSYDYGDYSDYSDYSGFDSYYPPKGKRRSRSSRRVRPRSRRAASVARARAQRQRRQKPRSRARVSRQRRARRARR